MHGLRKSLDIVPPNYCASTLGIAKVLELTRHVSNSIVENAPGDFSRLAQDVRRLLGVTPRLVSKAPPLPVDLEAASHDDRPSDQNILRCRDRTVSLIGAKVSQISAEPLAPNNRVATVTRMTKIKRVRHFGNEAAHQFRIAAIAVAGEHKTIAFDVLGHAVAASERDASDRPILLVKQTPGNAARKNVNIARFRSAA